MVEFCLLNPGARIICAREVQKSLKESAKRLIEDKINAHGVGRQFEVQRDQINTPGGGVIVFVGMQDHTSESIKSFEGFDVAWIEEAQSISERSLTLLRPTIRKPGSELWFSWNPRWKHDAVDRLLRGKNKPPGAEIIRANWSDNPWFPHVLEDERKFDKETKPDLYGHIWEGEYATVTEGAYFAEQLRAARREGRVSRLARDPMMQVRTYWDLGVADSMSIWVAQIVDREIRVLDYIEGQGQPLSYYAQELRDRDFEKALCVLPHDGDVRDNRTALTFEEHLKAAGFKTDVIKNQGKGAAMRRIEAARRLFPRIWFNDTPAVSEGMEALGAYHEKRDEDRLIGLGPSHDWASHAADSFGLLCIAYEEPRKATTNVKPRNMAYA